MKYLILNSYTILLMIMGFGLFFWKYKLTEKSNRIFKIILVLTGLINILNIVYIKYFTTIITVLGVSAEIVLIISLLLHKKWIKYLYLSLIINILVCFLLIVINVFNIDLVNCISYTFYITYLIIFSVILINNFKNSNIEKQLNIVFVILMFILSSLIDFITVNNLFLNNTILLFIIFQYLYFCMEDTKIDPLTKLSNRQTFYNDMREYDESITAVMSIDMNGLKYINDKYGHHEGDKSLRFISKILKKYSSNNYKFYRIGGDEFTCLCLNQTEKQIKTIIKKIKTILNDNNYSCSFGFEMRKEENNLISIYKLADGKMYDDKRKYYQSLKK